MFQHATHTIVVLDIAWPWASEAFGLCRLCAYFCAHKLVRPRSYWPYGSTDRCFKHATKSTVALDTAWPWANDTYGLCCLRAYFCVHKVFRARSYVVIPCCARGGERVPVLGAVAGCWVCVVDCELAVRVVQTGCGCWELALGAVSWLRAWWKQGAGCWLCACGAVSWRTGAGCACVRQGAAGLLVLVVCVVQFGCWCRVLALAVRVVETRHAVLRWCCCQCRCSPKKSFACFCCLQPMVE